MNIRVLRVAIFGLFICMAMALLPVPPGVGEDIPVTTIIENTEPEIMGLRLLDESSSPTSSVNPGSQFHVEVLVRDNNTLLDLVAVKLVLYSPWADVGDTDSEEDHYTFLWEPSGFSNPSGVGTINTSASSCPSNLDLGEGLWRFTLQLSKKATQSPSWTILARAEDEANTTDLAASFTVNSYISLRIDTSSISFSGPAGQTVGAHQNPITITYAANQEVSLGCSCTQFTGVQEPNIAIDPQSFSVDDDASPDEAVETGGPQVALSTQTQDVLQDLPSGSHDENIHIFVDLPVPFFDQDYSGTLTFQLIT